VEAILILEVFILLLHASHVALPTLIS